MSKYNGSGPTSPQELLAYWIREREQIRRLKELGAPKPWSNDPIFQNVYFCNVRREDDKTTRFIRQKYQAYGEHPWLVYNYVLARFLNRIETLKFIPFMSDHAPTVLMQLFDQVQRANGQLWGGAYIITTHGLPMGKVQYLVNHVLEGVSKPCRAHIGRGPVQGYRANLATAYATLLKHEGLGSFLAAQIVADLKNTPGHPLASAEDFYTFAAHGPGSLRGASWFHYGEIGRVTPATFNQHFNKIREYIDDNVPEIVICNQDLQNCLCEFDKYMRVRTGVGKSKRKYNGR
jgi:hypothetical protein